MTRQNPTGTAPNADQTPTADAFRWPSPHVQPETAPYWQASQHVLPYCDRCDRWFWAGQRICPACAEPLALRPTSGQGTVEAVTVVHRTHDRRWRDAVPYAVVAVRLKEGPRLIANVVGSPPEKIRIGTPVRVVLCATDDPHIRVPVFETT